MLVSLSPALFKLHRWHRCSRADRTGPTYKESLTDHGSWIKGTRKTKEMSKRTVPWLKHHVPSEEWYSLLPLDLLIQNKRINSRKKSISGQSWPQKHLQITPLEVQKIILHTHENEGNDACKNYSSTYTLNNNCHLLAKSCDSTKWKRSSTHRFHRWCFSAGVAFIRVSAMLVLLPSWLYPEPYQLQTPHQGSQYILQSFSYILSN